MRELIQYPIDGVHRHQIRVKGRQAGIDCKTPGACPYRRDSNKAEIWLDGFFSVPEWWRERTT